MNVASLENCKKLYELSRWDKTAKWWYNTGATGWKLDTGHAPLTSKYYDNEEKFKPAYDLGYLLRKLPKEIMGKNKMLVFLSLHSGGEHGDWWANYETGGDSKAEIEIGADTPEDACALLCIKLFEENILERKH